MFLLLQGGMFRFHVCFQEMYAPLDWNSYHVGMDIPVPFGASEIRSGRNKRTQLLLW